MEGPEVQKADPGKRKAALLLAAVGVVLVAIAIWLLQPLESWLAADPSQLVFRTKLLIGGLLLLAVPINLICVHMWRVGKRTVDAARYPPPGLGIVRDTIVLTGAAAKRRGQAIQWGSVLMAIASVLPPVAMWFLVWMLTRGVS